MSIESAKAFMERVRTDEDFKNRVQSAEDKETRLALVKSEGFDFTPEDVASIADELSDEELENVSAGGCWDYPGIFCNVVGWK